MHTDDKHEFITGELWILAWSASVQRSKLYKDQDQKDSHKNKRKFRKDVITFVSESIIPQYQDGTTEEQHYKNIDDLIAYANKIDPGILIKSQGYKYGVAQKLLNLALKYYWCLGFIKEPPHCPVDSIVISETKLQFNWTEIKKRAEYQKIIEEIKILANKDRLSVPVWELRFYSRRGGDG